MPDWFEDESFWQKLYPFLFTDNKVGAAGSEVASVLELAGLEHGDVLDLACGPGRHSIALAKRGFRVTGVDLSSFLLRKARERARAEGADVEWVQEDMRRFVRPDSFDLAVSLFTSLSCATSIGASAAGGPSSSKSPEGNPSPVGSSPRPPRNWPTAASWSSDTRSSTTGPVSGTSGLS